MRVWMKRIISLWYGNIWDTIDDSFDIDNSWGGIDGVSWIQKYKIIIEKMRYNNWL